MIPLREAFCSSIGRKLLTSVTGIGLGLFVIIHLLGNLMLYPSDGSLFNEYAHAMAQRPWLVWGGDAVLLLGFILHVINSLLLKFGHKKARGGSYGVWKSKAKPSMNNPSNISSRAMAISGIILLAFIPLHILHFKFGPSIAEGYYTLVNGEEARDLHRWVVESFSNIGAVIFYVVAMLALGNHLRHGYWSFFQSMGLVTPRNHRALQVGGAALGLLLSFGFLMIPVWIYIRSLGGAS